MTPDTLIAAIKDIRDELQRPPVVEGPIQHQGFTVLVVNVQGWLSVDRSMWEVTTAVTAAGGVVVDTNVLDVGDDDCYKTWGTVMVQAD